MLKKIYLMTPGPTPVPDEVRLAEAQPIIHHRTKEFSEIFNQVSEDIKIVFKTENPVLIFASSGTGAMEAAVVNTLSPGDKVLAITGGKFGERWRDICKAFGLNTLTIDPEWGDRADPEDVKSMLNEHPDIKAVFAVLSETSTGTLEPIKELGEIIKGRDNTIFVVDAISGLGACNIEVDGWSVDICVTGSQKGLMMPPGLAFVSISDKAMRFVETSKLPKYYWDFKAMLKSQAKGQTAYTPAVSLIVGLKSALDLIKQEGMDNILARHHLLAEATREAVKTIGLELLSKYPADSVTAIKAPQGIDGETLKKQMDTKYGVKVAGGQAHLKGKIIRIAHLGYMGPFDTIAAIAALEMALNDLGYPVELGKGVKKALEIIYKGWK